MAVGKSVTAASYIDSNNPASRLKVESQKTLLVFRHMADSHIDLCAGEAAKLIHTKSLKELDLNQDRCYLLLA